jgi:zona occludens toxin (predicted ATPase)
MSVTCYYGLPGCGKTTVLTAIAQRELRRIRLGKSVYSAVLTNFYCRNADVFKPSAISTTIFRRCLILIDEVTLVWDSRNFKTFPEEVKEFFTLHRHLRCDVIYATQYYQNVDKRIRDVTVNTFRVRKLGPFHLTCKEKMAIQYPEQTGEILVGYKKPSILYLLTTLKVYFGRRYYDFFDTHEIPVDGAKRLYSSGVKHI